MRAVSLRDVPLDRTHTGFGNPTVLTAIMMVPLEISAVKVTNDLIEFARGRLYRRSETGSTHGE